MNRNFYLNFILTVATLILIVFGLMLINAVDRMRLRTESLMKKVDTIENLLETINNELENRPAITVNQSRTSLVKMSATPDNRSKNTNQKHVAIANLEFFDKNAVSGGRLITAITSETKNMNYLVNNESLVGSLWGYCYDSLAERNFKNPEIFEPQMAKRWELSGDKLTYTIYLRKGILWHDFKDPVTGKEWKNVEVTAHDFKFYLDVVKNEKTDCSPSRTYLKDMGSIEIISDYVFKVHWDKKYFLSESITLGLNPLPRHLYHAYKGPFNPEKFNDDHERNRIIVGCGAYRFDRWDKGQKIILKRWNKYYGKRYGVMPPLEFIVLEVIKHPNTQLQALFAGDIDRMGLSADQWVNKGDAAEFAPKTGTVKRFKYLSRSYSYIGYNLKNPLFQNKLVRQAMTHLVDRKRILKEVYHDLGRIITGNFFIETPYYDKSIQPFPYSVKTALELMKKAGWTDTDSDGILDKDGQKFEFTILQVANHPTQTKILQIVKEDMAKAGIVMKINNVEWSVYVQRLEKKSFEVCILGWGLGFESDPYQLWHSSQADKLSTSNHIGFKNKEADKLIEQIRVCFDLKKRIELCHKFHRLMHEEQPYTFLFTRDSLIAQNKRYQNVKVFPGGLATRIMWVPKNLQKSLINQ